MTEPDRTRTAAQSLCVCAPSCSPSLSGLNFLMAASAPSEVGSPSLSRLALALYTRPYVPEARKPWSVEEAIKSCVDSLALALDRDPTN